LANRDEGLAGVWLAESKPRLTHVSRNVMDWTRSESPDAMNDSRIWRLVILVPVVVNTVKRRNVRAPPGLSHLLLLDDLVATTR